MYYYHLDQLNTPRFVTNNKAEVVWENQADVYGYEESEVNNTNNFTQPIRFQGQYLDEESGLHYNRYRYYSPKQQRFINQDPIGLVGGINHYQYAPNPVNWVDPFGLSCKENITEVPADGIVTFPNEPWESVAYQDVSPEAIAAREYVANGGKLYRIGKMGKSDTSDAQFWAMENPSNPGYAARYGIPKDNVENSDFLEVATIKRNSVFVTRVAPADPDGLNPGGGIEVVVPKDGVKMDSFSAGHKTPYTGN
ncbi:MAG: RHS repeat-associated core domain-containing protein [Pseudoalteromonas sp.]|uniref:RHS repeat-associated core domain-containing protein n=1 Tax=Pseudoalteromonas prydzensis TaxID=182141 RepID=UPI003F9A4590